MKKTRGIIKKKTVHDAGYKALLSHPEVVQDLITFFVHTDYVKDIDFGTLTPYRENFVVRGRIRRSLDIVWSVRIKDRGTAYFFILLEPQSTVYRWMPVRVLIYILLLYQDLIAKKKVKKHEKLPPVLPIVIYRGKRRWKAPLSVETLIEMPFEEFAPFVPRFSYQVIEARQPEKLLLSLRSIMAKVFLFETVSIENLNEVFESFLRLYKAVDRDEFKDTLKHWYQNKMDEMGMESVDLDEWEADRMFEVNVRKYKAKLRAEGKEEGRKEGLQEANLIHAREMKALNVDREIIKKVTGIDIDSIE